MRLFLQLVMVSCLAAWGLTACGGDDGPGDGSDQTSDVGDDSGGDADDEDAGDLGGEDAGDSGGEDADADDGGDTSAGACSPDPCQNGGTCHLQDTGYQCECADGFFGTDCEYEAEFDAQCADGVCISAGRIFNPSADPDELGERKITLRDGGDIVDEATLDENGFYAFRNAPRATLEKSLQQALDDDLGPEPVAGCDDCDGACWNGFCYTQLPADKTCIEPLELPDVEMCSQPPSSPGGPMGTGPDAAHVQYQVTDGGSSQNALEIITNAKIAPLGPNLVGVFTDSADSTETDVTGELVLEEGGELSGEVQIVVSERFGEQRQVSRAVLDNENRTFTFEALSRGTYDVRVGGDSFEDWKALRLTREASVSLVNDPDNNDPYGIEIIIGPGPFIPGGP